MFPTPDPHINGLLATLLADIQQLFAQKLVGLYLYGSLVTGDFDHRSSDIDLVAALAADVEPHEIEQIRIMHDRFAEQHAQWLDRIEVQYVSVAALEVFKTQTYPMTVISPGEPLHIIEADAAWLVNWYVVQQHGITLCGPAPGTLIDPISPTEFVAAVRGHMQHWRDWINDLPRRAPSQAYVILTMCRGLYTATHGEQVSKLQAARWAQRHLPQWVALIEDALRWRADWRVAEVDQDATFSETRRFVDFMIDLSADRS